MKKDARSEFQGLAAARLVLLALVGIVGFGLWLFAEEPGEPLSIGRTVTIHSDALGEDRTVLVTTPAGYEQGARKYPVVYVLDGETNHLLSVAVTNFYWQNGLMPPVIVVSVTNTARTRDFTPTAVADRQGSGGGPKFMEFLKNELLPFVEKNYRTEPYRVLIGHSLCGMYAVWTLLSEPDLFQAFIAISPYLQYDNDCVVRLAEERLPGMSDRRRFLYITLGNEPEYNASIDRLLGLIRKKGPKSLEVRFNPMKAENHGTVRLKSVYEGMAALYAGWRLPDDLTTLGIPGIRKHFEALSARFGYTLGVPEPAVNQLGYQLLNQKKFNEAIEVFRKNIELFPESANVYDSLGEALEQAGKLEEARQNYLEAVTRAEKTQDRNLPVFRQHLTGIESKIKGK